MTASTAVETALSTAWLPDALTKAEAVFGPWTFEDTAVPAANAVPAAAELSAARVTRKAVLLTTADNSSADQATH